jgi:HSP20 family protein
LQAIAKHQGKKAENHAYSTDTLAPVPRNGRLFDQYARAMHRALLRHEERSAVAEIADWAPTVDVSETDDAYEVRAELPGVDKDDVDVSLENGVLTIKGEKKVAVTEGHGEKKHTVECAYGSFLPSFVLPSNADAEKVDASFKHGVLKLSIAKTTESKAKKIEVKGE